jgi:hypothetical protein
MPDSVFRTRCRAGLVPGFLLVLFKLLFGVPAPPAHGAQLLGGQYSMIASVHRVIVLSSAAGRRRRCSRQPALAHIRIVPLPRLREKSVNDHLELPVDGLRFCPLEVKL